VILSVSLDSEEQKWREFIGKNEMSWPQYRDGGFTGPIAKMFNVTAIPHTFTIDVDGVLQEEHVGDASIEGKRTATHGDYFFQLRSVAPVCTLNFVPAHPFVR
jgi:hypothetical protein